MDKYSTFNVDLLESCYAHCMFDTSTLLTFRAVNIRLTFRAVNIRLSFRAVNVRLTFRAVNV